MRSYLRLTRAHTVPLEAVPAAVGALLATQGQITAGVLLWCLYGIGYHLTGYGMNSYTDWYNGYDQDDPHKQHHPLNTGELSKKRAGRVVAGIGILTAILGIALSYDSSAIVIILIGVLFGASYNLVGKETLLKPALISIAHSTVFAAPYIAMGGEEPLIGIGGTAMVFMWVFYQIAVSGELKDMSSDEANILKDVFNCENEDGAHNYISDEAKAFSTSLKIITVVLFCLVAFLSSGVIYTVITLIVGAITVAMADRMIEDASGEYDRDKLVKQMSQIEMMTVLMFLTAFGGTLHEIAFATFALAGAWVLTFNKALWGTSIAPKV